MIILTTKKKTKKNYTYIKIGEKIKV